MSILSRFGEIMESNVNDLLDKAEDPVKMAKQSLRKLDEQLAEIKEETAEVMGREKSAKQRVDELQKKVDEYTNSAKNALKSGQEEDAKTLIGRKQEYESQLATAKQNWQVANANAENMKKMYNKLNADRATLTDRLENVKSQTSIAKANERAAKITEKMGRTNVSDTFARMEEKAQEKLNKSAAKIELGGVGLQTDEAQELNAKYSAGSNASVDDELVKMKREMGLM